MNVKDKARTRQAKGSVQEAIGKIIGDVTLEKRGSIESKAGAKQAEAASQIDPKTPIDPKSNVDKGSKN